MSHRSHVTERNFGPKVIVPRRIKADLVDGLIGAAILVVPLMTADAMVDKVPDLFVGLSVLAWPASLLYVLFRDVWGNGTSWGKRLLGLRIIDTRTGDPTGRARVAARNIVDPIPLVSAVDFWFACADRNGQKYMDKLLDTQIIEGARATNQPHHRKTKNGSRIMNSLMVIYPYRYNGMWVFDDESVGLVREPFVAGADNIIDHMVRDIPGAEKGFNLVFSSVPFPDHQAVLERRAPHQGGYWYYYAR
jgi:uncharacterized RDD family membrane protein YckC